ncbi:hypothetical protein FHU29_004616, partial [Hoyosella altamirensis]|nr:hypothetical protein [Hoyosella altamirensis]
MGFRRRDPDDRPLTEAAEVYKRALGVFFLSEPHQDFDTLRNFRRIADAEADVWSPELH